ncbi:PREDICTED: WPP domain-interacting protein 1-like [Nicotiana attenuata]|uniref:Wpp domain-interacting protein 1 n=1 Tax=Nicotiana attenuata TaxID=49451 RepID=A0A1J6I3R6_NICAT|nr:PREDICTED: WPP domain-interacting protein 1-like [Nicotiana attenuata]XP_019251844.1 PREDICTED: WPP domain-interacting protein 1-like [Nicotiana attenuata]OIS99161.1 wpp domain-interacting protein 1 [Nicotiana attenuata]
MTTLQDLDDPDRNKVENNGSSIVEINTPISNEVKGKGVDSPPPMKSSPITKGFGLKKWRRIRRESHKDGDSNTDSGKLLKRGLSNAAANSVKPVHLSAGAIQNSDGSVSSTNALLRSPGVLVDAFGVIGDPGLADRPLIFGATDSENSEDRSSRSSTAASAPKARYESPVVYGYVPDKNGQMSLSGKNVSSLAQKSHQGKGRAETSKKPRGERVKIEKENSLSSMDSDSQSSNFLCVQSNNHVTTNGIKDGMSVNNGQFNDEAFARERPVSEEFQTCLDGRNGKNYETQEDLAAESPWDVKEERSENQGLSADHDPLLESIVTLQAAQDKLEREIQKFKDIGIPSDFGSDDTDFPGLSTSEQSQSRNGVQHSFNSLESEVVSLKQNVILLQNKLNEEADLLKLKEARVTELEAILSSNSKKEEKKTGNDLHQSTEDIEKELEGLFRQKFEAEIEYLAISRTIQTLRAAAIDQVTLLEEQKILAMEQAQMVKKLGDSETKTAMLKSQAESLANYCDDVASTNKTRELQKGVCKYSSYFLIQLVLLVIVFGLYVLQMSPDAVEVVPT